MKSINQEATTNFALKVLNVISSFLVGVCIVMFSMLFVAMVLGAVVSFYENSWNVWSIASCVVAVFGIWFMGNYFTKKPKL